MADDAAPLLHGPGQEPRDVDEGHDWHVEHVAGADEAGGLDRGVDVEASGQHLGLVGHHPDRLAVEAGESDDDVLGVAREQLEEPFLVNDLLDDAAHVVRAVRVRGDCLAQSLALPVPLVGVGNLVGLGEGVVGQEGEDLRGDVYGVFLILCHKTGHPAATGVLLRPA